MSRTEFFQKQYTNFDRFAQWAWIGPMLLIFAMMLRAAMGYSTTADPIQRLLILSFLICFIAFIGLRAVLAVHEKTYESRYLDYLSE